MDTHYTHHRSNAARHVSKTIKSVVGPSIPTRWTLSRLMSLFSFLIWWSVLVILCFPVNWLTIKVLTVVGVITTIDKLTRLSLKK